MNTNFKVIGLTRLGIKPESSAPEADALTTRPFELSALPACAERLVENLRISTSEAFNVTDWEQYSVSWLLNRRS